MLKATTGVATILEITDQGVQQPVPVSEEYYPILFSEPTARKELPIGYDLASRIATRTALETAASNNQAIASTPITVSEGGKSTFIYFISLPLYNKSMKAKKIAGQLKGFVVGLYDIDAIFSNVLDNAWSWDTTNSIALEDMSSQVSAETLISVQRGENVVDDSRFEYTKQLTPIADLQWFLVARPSESYFKKHRTAFPYMLGVVFCCLLHDRSVFACFATRG
jgi:CHASE1-domain containing sensor protein